MGKREIATLQGNVRVSHGDHVGDVSFADPNITDRKTVAHSETRPLDPIAALMECAPFEDPEVSRTELSHLRDIIQDAIEAVLTDRERWVFDGVASRRASLRDIAQELSLSKSQVHNIYNACKIKLATRLIEDDNVKRWLNGVS